jgi:hypothetical protein
MRKRAFIWILATGLLAAAPAAGATGAARSDGSTAAPASVVKAVRSVPSATLDFVGLGALRSGIALTRLSGAAVAPGSRATVISMNAAWCPHCAANSWALAITLGRFGTLTGLRVIDSGTFYGTFFHANPAYPHTKGLSFLKARYTSRLVSFQPIVLGDRTGRPVQTPTRSQARALRSFDPSGGVPAVYLGGAYGVVGSATSPRLLAGLSAPKIASELADPTSALAPYIDGQANILTAALCVATGQQPASVCGSAGVRAAAATLPPAPGGKTVFA